MSNSIWTPDLITRLGNLWPNHSASEISKLFAADGFSISRGAVIGKTQRLGFSAKIYTHVPKEVQEQKRKIREDRYKAARALNRNQSAVVLRSKGQLSQRLARRLEPMSKAELMNMLAQAVRNTQAMQISA